MTLLRMGVVAIFGVGLLATGCGYSCANMCEDLAECKDNDTNPDDCDPLCEIIERRAEDMGCDEDLDKLVDCVGELDDACDAQDDDPLDDKEPECADEAADYSKCQSDFCNDHPNNDDC
ncbi:MAG TPA: hypothetical protein VF103_13025 [Polyangiaceae bacterium]